MSLEDRLLDKIRADILLDTSADLDADTDLLLTGLVDSLGLLTLVSWLEKTLNLTIDPGAITLENFFSVTAIVAFVETLGAAV